MCIVRAHALFRQPKQTGEENRKKNNAMERIASGLAGMEKCVRERKTLFRRTKRRKTFGANFVCSLSPFSLPLLTIYYGSFHLECNIFAAGLFFCTLLQLGRCCTKHTNRCITNNNKKTFFHISWCIASHHIFLLYLLASCPGCRCRRPSFLLCSHYWLHSRDLKNRMKKENCRRMEATSEQKKSNYIENRKI